jgi:EAL and modified HD-GYP domain-containing signal transduction protein
VEVFVARQAILDRDRRVHGYELLFRSGGTPNEFDGTESGAATTQVLANSLLAIGLDNLVGRGHAFVNFGRDLLLADWHCALPKQSAVIEVLETVNPDPAVLEACRKLHDQGYRIALDDFAFHCGQTPLLEFASVVKVEIQELPRKEQEALVRFCRGRGLKMLAEKVETHEEFEWARRAGYDYFQGYFFARPLVMQARQIPTVKLNCLRLLREAQRPELDLQRLEHLIMADVSFAYKLLRYVNSALFARPTKIRSIRQALLYLGDNDLRKWIVLAALPRVALDKPGELVILSLVRARMCESLAEQANNEPGQAFLTGLFSLLDALVDRTLDDALAEVNLAPEISSVLKGSAPEDDSLHVTYQLARAYERADWDQVQVLGRALNVWPGCISEAYYDALRWSREALRNAA